MSDIITTDLNKHIGDFYSKVSLKFEWHTSAQYATFAMFVSVAS